MYVGLLTAPFGKESMEEVVAFAAEAGFAALEVAARPGSKQIDPATVTPARIAAVRSLVEKKGLKISSLACYLNVVDPNPDERRKNLEHLRKGIDVAKALGTDVVCTLAGMPLPGKNKMQTIEQDLPGALGPIIQYAGGKGIKIAMENWFATNIRHLGHWRRVFEVLPAPNFGLNYDPSHLYWQQIDYLAAVEEVAPRIFHTHAKDCEIMAHKLRSLGVLEYGWWRYVIPGFGKIGWGEYIEHLRRVKFDGVLSIEHEDGAFGREEGFRKGLQHLQQFV